MEQEISAHLLKLRRTHPFLATISLFARYRFNNRVDSFETDGNYIDINPDYFKQLKDKQKTGVLLHVTLHAALLHPQRIALRNPSIWNIAADIVVNNTIFQAGSFEVPPKTAFEEKYADLCVEQVYEALMHIYNKSETIKKAALAEVNSNHNADSDNATNSEKTRLSNDKKNPCSKSNGKDSNEQASLEQSPSSNQVQSILEKLYPYQKDLVTVDNKSSDSNKTGIDNLKTRQYWQNAFRKADAVTRLGAKNQGQLPEGLLREINQLLHPELDWRWILWNFVARTPTDFEGFDRRFAYQGLYLDQLQSDRLNVLVAVDTSGSIDESELTKFISELVAITNTYNIINVILYYVDAAIYGPYQLIEGVDIAPPMGGGGTDFSVFYQEVVDIYGTNELDLVVYFTDGYGEFPQNNPTIETLWVVTSGGLESDQFPFGQVTRLNE